MSSKQRVLRFSALVTVMALTAGLMPPALAADAVGSATAVVPNVTGFVDGALRTLVSKAKVFHQEQIRAGGGAATEIVFNDGSTLHIGAGTELTLDEVVFDPDASRNVIAIAIKSGLVRFASGNTPDDKYRITTPTTVIGIRGTRFLTNVAADGETLVAVEEGEVVVTNADGEAVTLRPGQSSRVRGRPGAGGRAPTPEATLTSEAVVQAANRLATTLSAAGGRGMGSAQVDNPVVPASALVPGAVPLGALPAATRAAVEKAISEKAAVDKAATEKAATEKAAADRAAADRARNAANSNRGGGNNSGGNNSGGGNSSGGGGSSSGGR